MSLHVALLRAVNLGSHNKVAMSDLRELLGELDFSGARSLLQSGNLVFEGDGRPPAGVERLLERAARERLGLETQFFVRSAKEWKAMVGANPFPGEARRDPAHLLLMVLKKAPDRKDVLALERVIPGRELVRTRGRQVYIVYPDGIGRSRLTNALIEAKLGTRGTARNWNTALKVAALLGA